MGEARRGETYHETPRAQIRARRQDNRQPEREDRRAQQGDDARRVLLVPRRDGDGQRAGAGEGQDGAGQEGAEQHLVREHAGFGVPGARAEFGRLLGGVGVCGWWGGHFGLVVVRVKAMEEKRALRGLCLGWQGRDGWMGVWTSRTERETHRATWLRL